MSGLLALLDDRERGPDDDMSAAVPGFAGAGALTAPFIVLPDYGTRSSTAVLLSNTGRIDITEARLEIDQVRDKIESMGLGREGVPMWLYLLAEAELIGRAEPGGNRTKGEGLGPVGARIVAETIIGLLELDDHSYLGSDRNWSPREEWDSVGKMLTVAQP